MRRQVELRPSSSTEFLRDLFKCLTWQMKVHAVETALQVRHPVSIQIVDRYCPCVILNKRRGAPVEPQLLFAKRPQLQYDQVRILQFVGGG